MLKELSFYATKNFRYKINGDWYCVCHLYIACLSDYDSGSVKKLVIEFSLLNEEEEEIDIMADVISIKKMFDFEKYFKLSEKYDKKKMLLEALHEGVMKIANQKGWEINQLIKAYNCCLEKNIENKWIRGDMFLQSPDKKYYAGILCNWDIDKFEAYAIFLNENKEEIKRIKLFEKEPWDVDQMGKMGWDKITNDFFLYLNGNNKGKLSISPTGQA